MMSVRKTVRFGLACAALATALCWSQWASAAQDRWLTSYDAALTASREQGLPVLTIFTGSDWCPHCRTLEDNVLNTQTFLDWADGRVILLMIDLPQQGITPAVRAERSQVCIKYGVRTFPSALLIAPDGQKLTVQSGYMGQAPTAWVAHFSSHLPAGQAARSSDHVSETASTAGGRVLPSLDQAVENAKTSKRPILLLVSKTGDQTASSRVASLIKDPEFEAFAHDNFVVATVPSTEQGGAQTDQHLEQLLGGVELGPEAVEMIVTDDGQTPLFSQSAAQPPQRLVNGLRRFLTARQTARNYSQRR